MNEQTFRDRIRDRRRALGLTQKQLGERMGVTEGSISQYESGHIQELTLDKAEEFARALTTNQIVTTADWLRTGRELKMVPLSADELAHIRNLRCLDDESRALVMRTAEKLKIISLDIPG